MDQVDTMTFWKLNNKHKFWFLINQIIVLIMLGIALIVSWNINKVMLPTNTERLTATGGFIVTTVLFSLAILNRVNVLFKVRSVGFAFMFIMFFAIDKIIEPLVWTTGLLLIPLLIDDIIFKSIWNNIWYNEYDGVVKIKE